MLALAPASIASRCVICSGRFGATRVAGSRICALDQDGGMQVTPRAGLVAAPSVIYRTPTQSPGQSDHCSYTCPARLSRATVARMIQAFLVYHSRNSRSKERGK